MRIERIDWANRPPMGELRFFPPLRPLRRDSDLDLPSLPFPPDQPQADYGRDGSGTGNAPAVLDPYDPNSSEDRHPDARRFGDDVSPSASEYNDSPYFDEDGHPRNPARLAADEFGDLPRPSSEMDPSYSNFLDSANR